MTDNGDALYYSKGVTDPDYRVLRFTATSGRHYANLSSQDIEIWDVKFETGEGGQTDGQ